MLENLEKIAGVITKCEILIITAGAGIGVDSGLPDFRGGQGFWKAYPPYQKLGLSFYEMATPEHFAKDPEFGWGFYGHRLNLYRSTKPHRGFHIMRDWIKRLHLDYFVITSNVDGQFQKAGYSEDKIYEIHGTIHYNQCLRSCGQKIWENLEDITIDMENMRAKQIPRCPRCNDVARPNILMFGDWFWDSTLSNQQRERYVRFLEEQEGKNIAVIEIGAGTAVPSIRHQSSILGQMPNTTVIRINPREPQIHPPHISLKFGALEGLEKLDSMILSSS